MEKIFQQDTVAPVKTEAGLVQGYRYDGLYIFKGVPYAQAKRFQAPRPVEAWEGVRECTSYGFVCPLLSQETPSAELMVPHRYWPMDENCQNLNIWSPALGEKKPVLVWLHGGGFTAGSSIEQVAYDGANMSKLGDTVVVSVNHRLNVLGYLDLSPFGEKYANSANAGHADLVAALRWIHDNIEAFGGDPENVTIFGQSGGGMKVTGLMQIPAADGLFQKGIVMSGVFDGKLLPLLPGDGRAIGTALLEELGLSGVEELETVSYHDLALAYNKVSPAIAMQGKYIGGVPMPNDYYKGEPLLEGFTEHAKTIPLMIGSVFGEFSFAKLPFNKQEMTQEQMLTALETQYGGQAAHVAELFQAAYPEKPVLDLLALDRVFRIPSKALAKLHAEGGKAAAYLYNFTLEFPVQNGKPAWHCSDIPYFFHNTDKVEVCGIPGVTEKLEEVLFAAVMQFARTGDPNHGGLPGWGPVTPEQEPTMLFDRTCAVKCNYDDELLSTVDAVLPPFSFMAMMAQDIQH